MFIRTRCLQITAALASISLLAGCGLLSDDSSDAAKRIVVGTTSSPSTLDPAAAWDGSWELYRNVYQTLLAFPTGSTKPQPDAAQNCEFTDAANESYRCTLKKGLKFSDGEALDAKAVKHSLDRIRTINSQTGPQGLFGSLDKIETPDALTVVFHLKTPDATFPFVLGSPAASLVAPKDYPADKVRDDGKVTGSGPFVLDSYKEGSEAVLNKNGTYNGFANRRNDGVTIRYFADSTKMVAALKGKEIDATYRGLSAPEIKDLQTPASHGLGVQVVENVGAEIRYLVFNPKDPQVAKPAGAPGHRPGHRPRRDRLQGLPGHRRAAVLDGPQGGRGPQDALLRQVRPRGRQEGPEDPQGRRDHPAGGADLLVHHRPLRCLHGRRVHRAQAPAGREQPLQGHPAGPALEGVPGRLQERRVPGLRPRLVPRLPGPGQLHRAVRRQGERGRYPVRARRDPHRPAAQVPPRERPRGRRPRVRAGPADLRRGRPAAAAVAGQAVRRRP